ncbi:hypothetical protein [Oceanicoccus sp. KOV_DT_Chl]|nr:hypothetical protein [Oceanicoccus sp. KOV_DT_Chl]
MTNLNFRPGDAGFALRLAAAGVFGLKLDIQWQANAIGLSILSWC